MKTKILGTITAVFKREYTRKNGTHGVSQVVSFESDGQTITDEMYRTDQEAADMGIRPGAVGTMTIDIRNVVRTSKDGGQFTVREWKMWNFQLANAERKAQTAEAKAEPQPAGTEEPLPY